MFLVNGLMGEVAGKGGREVVKTTSNKDEGGIASVCLMLRFA